MGNYKCKDHNRSYSYGLDHTESNISETRTVQNRNLMPVRFQKLQEGRELTECGDDCHGSIKRSRKIMTEKMGTHTIRCKRGATG